MHVERTPGQPRGRRLWRGLSATALLVCAAQVGAQSLLDTYKLARQADPRFRAAQFDSQASGTAIAQARAGFRPVLRFDYDRVDSRQRILRSENPIFGVGVTSFPTDTQTLSITQPLFRKEAIERLSQAKAVVRQAEFALLAAEQDLMVRTTAAYLGVMAANDNLALTLAERDAVGRSLELAREKLKTGLGTITALHDATARFAITQAREIEARYKLNDARQALREITGQVPGMVQALRADAPLPTPQPPQLDRWVSLAADQNLLLQARRAGVEVARLEVERQRAAHYPSVNLLLSQNRRDSGSTLFGGGSTVDTTEVAVRLSVPLYEGGLTSAVTTEAAFRYQKSMAEQEQEQRAVERQTRAAFEGTLGGAGLVQALAQLVQAQQGALDAKEEGFRSGLFPLLAVLDAQRDLFMAKRDHAQARYDYLLSRLKLTQAAGTLAEADLTGVGEALQ